MKRIIFPTLFALGLAAGCAGPTASQQRPQPLAGDQRPDQYPAAAATMASAEFCEPASALVFDLPVARDVPPLNLDRASREPAAFVGFEGPSAEYHTVLINSFQGAGSGDCCFGDSYQRQDFVQRTSVRYR